jgi:hypothetical protein
MSQPSGHAIPVRDQSALARGVCLLVVGTIALIAALVYTSQSKAVPLACPSQDETIFWSGPSNVYGDRNEIGLTNRTLDPACTSPSNHSAGSTSHMMLGLIYGNWVETGWIELGDHSFIAFTEWGLNFNALAQNTFTASCLQPGTFQRWQVNYYNLTSWDTWFDCEDGQGFRHLKLYTDTGYQKGLLAGETFRRGSTTGMGDVHRNIQWLNSAGGTWSLTTGMQCKKDWVSGWQGTAITGSRYDTVQGSSDCNN